MPFDRREDQRRDVDRRENKRRLADRRKGPELRPVEEGPRTQEEVNQLRSHLEYEMWMLKETVDYITLQGQRVGESDMNAYLESFLLHATTLVDFYFPFDPTVREDVIAEEFIPQWSDHVDLSDQLRRLRESANRGLGRLSYRTLELPTKKQLAAIYEELDSIRSRFELLLKTQEEEQPPASE